MSRGADWLNFSLCLRSKAKQRETENQAQMLHLWYDRTWGMMRRTEGEDKAKLLFTEGLCWAASMNAVGAASASWTRCPLYGTSLEVAAKNMTSPQIADFPSPCNVAITESCYTRVRGSSHLYVHLLICCNDSQLNVWTDSINSIEPKVYMSEQCYDAGPVMTNSVSPMQAAASCLCHQVTKMQM